MKINRGCVKSVAYITNQDLIKNYVNLKPVFIAPVGPWSIGPLAIAGHDVQFLQWISLVGFRPC